MVGASAMWLIAVVIFLFTARNAQPAAASQPGEGQEAISWEMYRQWQVEMQLEMQRQRQTLDGKDAS